MLVGWLVLTNPGTPCKGVVFIKHKVLLTEKVALLRRELLVDCESFLHVPGVLAVINAERGGSKSKRGLSGIEGELAVGGTSVGEAGCSGTHLPLPCRVALRQFLCAVQSRHWTAGGSVRSAYGMVSGPQPALLLAPGGQGVRVTTSRGLRTV